MKRYTSPSGILALWTKSSAEKNENEAPSEGPNSGGAESVLRQLLNLLKAADSTKLQPRKYLLPVLQQLGPERLCGPTAPAPAL